MEENLTTEPLIEEISVLTEESEPKSGEDNLLNDQSEDLECDLAEISEELPEIQVNISEIDGNERYSELRALGLSAKEAYLATRQIPKATDNRSHLTSAAPKGAAPVQNQMSRQQLNMARSIFEDLDDSEIRRLYKIVTK